MHISAYQLLNASLNYHFFPFVRPLKLLLACDQPSISISSSSSRWPLPTRFNPLFLSSVFPHLLPFHPRIPFWPWTCRSPKARVSPKWRERVGSPPCRERPVPVTTGGPCPGQRPRGDMINSTKPSISKSISIFQCSTSAVDNRRVVTRAINTTS